MIQKNIDNIVQGKAINDNLAYFGTNATQQKINENNRDSEFATRMFKYIDVGNID